MEGLDIWSAQALPRLDAGERPGCQLQTGTGRKGWWRKQTPGPLMRVDICATWGTSAAITFCPYNLTNTCFSYHLVE